MADNPIATVYVTVLPETSRVAADIKRALREVDPEAREAGKRWGKEIKDAIGPIKPEVKPETVSAKAELERFRREEERKKIRQKIEFDEGDFRRKLELVGKEFDGVGAKFASAGKFNLGLAGIGLIAPAATALANLAGTVQQLAGAGLALPGVFAGMATSMGTAALGAHGMKDALEAITKASDGTQASVDAANKALAELSPNAAETVKTVAGLKGTFDDLQHIAGQNMFEGVSQGLRGMAGNLLPSVTRGIDGVSRALNQNLLQAMNSLGSGSSQGFLSRIFGNTANAQGQLTGAIDPIIHAMGTLAAAGSDTLPRLAAAVGKVADRFNNFITAADGDGRLAKWISEGLDGFTKLGNIVLNIGKSFTAVTQAAGGGGGLLSMLQSATEKMQLFLNSTAGQDKMKQFFADGRNSLGQLKDIAVELGPILGGVFNAGLSAANMWLPVIREILTTINSIPGGAGAVVGAFVLWKTIQGPVALLNSLTNVATMLKVTLPTAAAEGAAAMTASAGTAATGMIAAFSRVLPVVGSIFAAYEIGQSANNPASPNYKGLAAPIVTGQGFDAYNDSVGANIRALRGQGTSPAVPTGPPLFGNGSLSGSPAGPGFIGNGGGLTFRPPSGGALFGGGPTTVITPSAPPPPAMPPPMDIPIPALSNYSAPVVTEAAKGGSGAAVNLPYTGTADPNGVYGMPAGTNSGGYGGSGAQFPPWVYAVGQQFGVKPSTYPGHQETNRNEAGYAPNPGHENRGIDWSGTPQAMQAFADYLKTVPGMEQVIWNGAGIGTGDTVEIAGGRSQPGYFASDLAGHGNHVHTRQSGPIPLPGQDPMASMYSGMASGGASSGGLTSSDLSLRNANQRVNDTQHSQEQAEARLNELRAKGTATDRQLEAAEYAVAKAKREHTDAIDSLSVATDKYNDKAAKGKGKGGDSGMSSLGTDLMGGIAQFFGFDGSLFQNPADFGIMKFITGAANLKVAGGDGSSLPSGGGGGGGLFDFASQFMPGMPGGNSPNLMDAVQFSQTGGPNSPGPGNNPGYQNSGIDLRGASFGDSHGELSNQLNSITSSQNRWGPLLQNAPK